MERILIFMMLLVTVSLASCNDDNDLVPEVVTSTVVFNLSERNPDAPGDQTRVAIINRYILEVYETSAPNTVYKRVEQVGGTFTVDMKNNTSYICLFWADGDGVAPQNNLAGDGAFDASNLKNVTLNTGKQMADAFFNRLDITDDTKNFNVTLKRATAQVNIIASDALDVTKEIKVISDRFNSFNALTSEATGTKVSTTLVSNPTTTTGNVMSFLTFASTVGILSDFTITYDSNTTNTLPSVPLKANFITNIRGNYTIGRQDYTIIVTVDENWGSAVSGVDVNVGTAGAPKWIRVADRNAQQGTYYNATASSTATDYGYYYMWSNATTDPSAANKAYSACYNFAEGEGLWRLPTKDELIALAGTAANNSVDATRKLKWINGPDWMLHSERIGQESSFVIFPMGGYSAISGKNPLLDPSDLDNANVQLSGSVGTYWSSTSYFRLGLANNGASDVTSYGDGGYSIRCVRDM